MEHLRVDREQLESLYNRLNRREFVHPDPLEFLYLYEDPHDREVTGLVASCLAYGRVTQILRSVREALDRLGERPARTLADTHAEALRRRFVGFRHRFTTGEQLAGVLHGAQEAIRRYGSLGALVRRALDPTAENVLGAASVLVSEIASRCGKHAKGLFPSPADGSACKRLNLFFRWMCRRDEVDPGGWDGIPPSKLIVPLDAHMHRLALALGLCSRKTADMATALEITANLKRLAPEDPVRYDFALTRLGIRSDPICRDILVELGLSRRPNARCNTEVA